MNICYNNSILFLKKAVRFNNSIFTDQKPGNHANNTEQIWIALPSIPTLLSTPGHVESGCTPTLSTVHPGSFARQPDPGGQQRCYQ